MTLTKQDLIEIKQILQPEFSKSEERIRKALQPEFSKLEKKLSDTIERLRQENRKDHNLILSYVDKQDLSLRKRISHLESHSPFPPLQ